MERRVLFRVLLTLFFVGALALAFGMRLVKTDQEEEWVPYVPYPEQVDLEFWLENQVAYVKVCITFGDAGYNVSDWGDVVREGYELWVNSEIWDWTGPAALVITTFCYTYNLGELEDGTYTFTFKAWNFTVKSIRFTIGRLISTVSIDPDALYLWTAGKWITAHVELPEGYNVSDINVTSILLNETVSVRLLDMPTEVGDSDQDGVPDLMVKFDRAEVVSYILANVNLTKLFEERFMTITLTVTGKLNDGTPFKGSDTIRIIRPNIGRPRLIPC